MVSLRTQRSLSLVMPAYNEEAVIELAVREADEALSTLGIAYEIIVVDDGSRDATAAIVTDLEFPNVFLVRHETNRGYGAALRTGFESARADWVAFTDADGQFHLEDLALLFEKTDTDSIVVGYRIDRQDPWQRRFYSWGYNKLIRLMLKTGVRDCDCALKLFRRDVLMDILPTTRGFFVNAEMICRARALGVSIGQAGVRHRQRRKGESKVSLMDIPRTLRQLIPFWWSQRVTPQPVYQVTHAVYNLGYPALRAPLHQPKSEPQKRAA
ncbi:glycosyltransferase family 2 protein [Telmatocola sphagniphila]|uniref:Glycosyltransferase family 2 protein n=2 Tax=Telmatocola sphagniphila TaxID=1123043 RepID=A0A8E6BD02_9BACT|nr:glycosyltransferase family 2 protein [Telmatocola sphagniphila]